MTRTVSSGVLLAAVAAVSVGLKAPLAATDNAARLAIGRGVMAFGEDGHSRGYLRFTVRDDGELSGTLLYAAEDHHHFPDIVVELGNIEKANFTASSVSFSGPGALHDDLVQVSVQAYDRGRSRADRFVIRCTDASKTVVFEADGELIRGNITVDSSSNEPAEQGAER